MFLNPFLWYLLVTTLLCNSTYTVYRLGYNEVQIRDSPFLQTSKELLLLKIFTLETIFSFTLPPSPPVRGHVLGPTTIGDY